MELVIGISQYSKMPYRGPNAFVDWGHEIYEYIQLSVFIGLILLINPIAMVISPFVALLAWLVIGSVTTEVGLFATYLWACVKIYIFVALFLVIVPIVIRAVLETCFGMKIEPRMRPLEPRDGFG